jgi:purine-cytosine permease-like protein
MQLVGSALAMRTGLYHEHLPRLIISPQYAGLGVIGFLAIGFAQWTTNDSNLYSSVLAFNNIIRWTRWKLAVVVGILSSLLAAWGILGRLELFLSLLSIAIGPIGGILVADYYFLGRRGMATRAGAGEKGTGGAVEAKGTVRTAAGGGGAELTGKGGRGEDLVQRWNPIAFASYFISFLIGWTTSGHPFRVNIFPFSIFAFNGIISAMLLYWAGMKIFRKKNERKQ